MANKKNNSPKKENGGFDAGEVVEVSTTPSKSNKTVKVKILSMLRGSYGGFDAGEVVEVSENFAKQLIETKNAELYEKE